MQAAVLVAGAGPVGLCAANVLADAGVPVTVLEAEPHLPENLRASTFQPPTLDMLARLGATRRLIEMGWVSRASFNTVTARAAAEPSISA
jgi:3-(3-hydroxy-phenyl)propionate hydroxylase